MNVKDHWESIYQSKATNEFSWIQEHPKFLSNILDQFNISKSASIIDIGGGDSYLVDSLIETNFTNLNILDISLAAIERAKVRLNKNSSLVNWICCNILAFNPTQHYKIWHDRAVFHFLTDPNDVQKYKDILIKNLEPHGLFALSTFSNNGPKRCSGLPVQQYSISQLKDLFSDDFEMLKSSESMHITPNGAEQHFVHVCFRKLN